MLNTFPIETIRKDFPILSQKIRGKNLVYLDSANSSQRPSAVLNKIEEIYSMSYANVHRGNHFLSSRISDEYENSRRTVASFLGTPNEKEIIFTRGTTESINLVAHAWGRKHIQAGDVIAVTAMEHHSNFVPWQILAQEKGAKFCIVELNSEGLLDENDFERILNMKPKLLAITHMSNVLGTILPLSKLTKKAKQAGATVFVDGAQSIVHLPSTLSDMGPIDFFAFSSHKIYGPTGIGVLWGKQDVLESMPPHYYGGAMISHVGDQESTWTDLPWRLEAGTPHIVGAISLATALNYMDKIGREAIYSYEQDLTKYALAELQNMKNLSLFGSRENQNSVISFAIDGVHHNDVASFLDMEGIAVRAGHHCTQPLMRRLGVDGTCRASFALYTTKKEIDFFIEKLNQAKKTFL